MGMSQPALAIPALAALTLTAQRTVSLILFARDTFALILRFKNLLMLGSENNKKLHLQLCPLK